MRELLIRLGQLLDVAPIAVAAGLLAWWPLAVFRSQRCDPRFAWRTAAVDIALVLTAVQVFYLVAVPVRHAPHFQIDLMPLREIGWVLDGHSPVWQVLGNILLLLPLFALAPLRSDRLNSTAAVLVAAALMSASIEAGQYVLRVGRVSSVDDVLLNVLGALIGALLTRPLWQSLTDEEIARHTWWDTPTDTRVAPAHR